MNRGSVKRWRPRLRGTSALIALVALAPITALAQQSSVSAWDAANFRMWAYIPYWATTTQINNFATNGMYSHVSDVLYFGGLRPDANGNITAYSSAYQTQFDTIRSQAWNNGFNLHLSMFEVSNGQTDATWTASSTARPRGLISCLN